MKHTGKDLAFIAQNMERDKFMSPAQAKEFGLIDKILEHPPKADFSTQNEETGELKE